VKRIIHICALGLGIVALLIAGLWAVPRYKTYAARQHWKEQAIPTIARLSENPEWIGEEIRFLKNGSPVPNERLLAEPWLSDRLILMESGEWLVYKSHCHKEPPRNVRDICIAKGSDGKWYYTTCHFCVRMIALMMMQDDQPKDLVYFIRRYHFRQFDGQSNECLEETKTFPDEL
jgi:hypothetical protein